MSKDSIMAMYRMESPPIESCIGVWELNKNNGVIILI